MTQAGSAWDLEYAGAACPLCYRPIDDRHGESDCELAAERTTPEEIMNAIGYKPTSADEWQNPNDAAEYLKDIVRHD